MPGIPGYQPDLDPYPYDLDVRQGAHGHGPEGARRRERRGPRQAQVRLQLRRRPRAAVAFLAEAWRQAFGLETEQIGSEFGVFLTAAHGRRVRPSPATAGAPTTRMRTTSWRPVHLRWRQQRQPVLQQGLRRPDRAGGRRAGPGQAGDALQAGADASSMDDAAHRCRSASGGATYEVRPYVGGLERPSPTDSVCRVTSSSRPSRSRSSSRPRRTECRWAGRRAGPPCIPSQRHRID